MSRILSDLKFGFRMFLKHPGFSLLSVLAFGLGIHLVTVQLLVIDAFLFRGLPLPDAERVVAVNRADEAVDKSYWAFHPDDIAAIAQDQTSFESLAGFYQGTINVSDGRNPRRYQGAFISPDFMRVLGVEPYLGRSFTEADQAPGAPRALMLSHTAWRRDFAGDPAVVGRSMLVNSAPGTVVGVMPPGIHFPMREDAWTPLPLDVRRGTGDVMFLMLCGRLRPGVSLEDASGEITGLCEALADESPERWIGSRLVEVLPLHRGFLKHESLAVLWVMLIAVLLVLAIACANVANLLLARASERGRELAVRSAVGATRSRLVLQMLGESFVLCLIGGIVGVFSVIWTIDVVQSWFERTELPFWIRLEFRPVVLFAVLGVTVMCACIAGIVPALRASRTDVLGLLQGSSRVATHGHGGWFGRTIIGVQVSMAFALLILAGMMIKTIAGLRHVHVPYDPASIISARFGLFDGDFPEAEQRTAFLRKLVASLEDDPTIAGAAITTRHQFQGVTLVKLATVGRDPRPAGDERRVSLEGVSAGYFESLGIDLLDGRSFTEEEVGAESPVAIVNAPFAELYFHGMSPIGQRIAIGDISPQSYTIIGVAPDLAMRGLGFDMASPEGMYTPITTSKERFFTVLARSSGDGSRAAPVVRRMVAQLDPNLPLYWVMTYAEAIEVALLPIASISTMFLWFGIAAVLLAAIGIYGVASFHVSQRTAEIGIRLALGADSGGVVGLIVRQGALQLVGGLLCGTLLALVLGSLIRKFLVVVGAGDLTIFMTVGVIISLVVFLSSFMPARRATHLTPMSAMRHE